MREDLEARGVEFSFGKRLDDLRPGVAGARWEAVLSDGSVVPTDHVVLAIGHSARDTYAMLARRGMAMQPKAFAIGTRIEHPQELIDAIQFGRVKGLPAADYKLTARVGQRGVWSFCMCPGGILLPTPADAGQLAVNGMSVFARDSGYANSAIVVNVRPEDYFRGDVLDGMRFQAQLETAAFRSGGGNYAAPRSGSLIFWPNATAAICRLLPIVRPLFPGVWIACFPRSSVTPSRARWGVSIGR